MEIPSICAVLRSTRKLSQTARVVVGTPGSCFLLSANNQSQFTLGWTKTRHKNAAPTEVYQRPTFSIV